MCYKFLIGIVNIENVKILRNCIKKTNYIWIVYNEKN